MCVLGRSPKGNRNIFLILKGLSFLFGNKKFQERLDPWPILEIMLGKFGREKNAMHCPCCSVLACRTVTVVVTGLKTLRDVDNPLCISQHVVPCHVTFWREHNLRVNKVKLSLVSPYINILGLK